MPKIQKLRNHALAHNPYKTTSSASSARSTVLVHKNEKTNGADASGEKVLSKGQKKRLQKKEKVMTKIGLISPVFQSAQLKKKKKEEDNALYSELEATMKLNLASDSSNNGVIKAAADTSMKSNKMKKSVAVREAARMKLVQQHPAFMENPIAAINLHLQQMISNKQDKKAKV